MKPAAGMRTEPGSGMGAEKSSDKLDQVVARARMASNEREKGYRAKALKMYPWICGRCTREFTHENLQELTVHHRDHNHDNNPQDGSNWELLCVYCHDNEHSRLIDAAYGHLEPDEKNSSATHNPFAGLANMFKEKK